MKFGPFSNFGVTFWFILDPFRPVTCHFFIFWRFNILRQFRKKGVFVSIRVPSLHGGIFLTHSRAILYTGSFEVRFPREGKCVVRVRCFSLVLDDLRCRGVRDGHWAGGSDGSHGDDGEGGAVLAHGADGHRRGQRNH